MVDAKDKNPEPNRAGTDINKNVSKVEKRDTENSSNSVRDPRASSTVRDEDNAENDEQRREKEEGDKRRARLDYATKVSESKDRVYLDDAPIDADVPDEWSYANRLIEDGYAVMHAEQRGMETKNYLVLTEEGTRAVQAHNAEKNRD